MSGRHLLVTNDFPPKIGGIQNYLWELWRRLPPDEFAIYTTPHVGAVEFDAAHNLRVERSPEPVLGPYPWLVGRINRFAREVGAELVLLDPAVPLGAIGPFLECPYGVILHGAEVTIPGRLPLSRQVLARTLRSASLVVAAGHYPLQEAERCAGTTLPAVVIPPGVDHERFHPLDEAQRVEARRSLGVADDEFLVATVNRLVPRKGIDMLVRAAALVASGQARGPDLVGGSGPRQGSALATGPQRQPVQPERARQILRVMIGGTGRHTRSLQRVISQLDAPVELLGRLSDDNVARLYGAADAMAMLCHDRWFGLEQEGFGIVFLEAAASGLPQLAGRSGGAHEAVEHGVTGLVVDDPRNIELVVAGLRRLIDDQGQRQQMGLAARSRVVQSFDYEHLATRLRGAINSAMGEAGLVSEGDLS